MRVTLFMVMSTNGIIARPDYREDFLSRENWDSFLECVRQTGALIWGRKTHEKVRKYGAKYFEPLAGTRNVVVTAQRDFVASEPGFEVAASPQQALEVLKARGCAYATLGGGSILNSAFARAGLIDEVVVNIEAVIVGRGIPLFSPDDFDLRLRIGSTSRITDRVAQLRTTVVKSDGAHEVAES